MGSSWFVPKTHGYGAFPANWKGWAAVAVFSLLLGLVAIAVFGPLGRLGVALFWQVALYLLLTTVLALGFIVIARRKTSSNWRWRWADDD
ncbi:hypothetical protein [Rhodovulum euryhalinum]|uniref:Uncharacterized protein n=1 Tax=Rhodovulum euryhalinum TaxID=35805 RepID=A0A4R2L040_9RHOB|nr:hypothetical protein [Rhodovulum euryhalinum]TCO72365.1 hypothetical protein EV655_10451 [Rhodovulum euryhalinum]